MSETVANDAKPEDDRRAEAGPQEGAWQEPSRAEEWTRQAGLAVVFALMGAAAIGIGATLGSMAEHKPPSALLPAEAAADETDALAAGIQSLSAQVQGLVARPGLAAAQSEVAAADAAAAQLQTALAAARTENAALKAQIARTLDPRAVWAAAELEAAARTARPFPAELAALQAFMATDADVTALAAHATAGAPTFDQLRARFRETELAVRRAARGGSNDFIGWLQDTMAQWVTVRRTGGQDDNAASAVLDRAKARLQVLDLDGAVNELKALQSKEAEAAAAWIALARARMDIDRRLAAVRERVLRDPALVPAASAAAPAAGEPPSATTPSVAAPPGSPAGATGAAGVAPATRREG